MKFLYLFVNICSAIIPLIFSFHPKIKFNNYFKEYFIANLISAFLFVVWDVLFTAQGIWGFSNTYTIGIKIFNLPIEEILFFFCIPFACIFTYHCLNKFYTIQWNSKFKNIFILFLSLGALIFGLIQIDKTYTASTFISTGLLILIFKYIFKVEWLPKIVSIYPLLLIPFFVVNGILTGYGLKEPIIWYNDLENLSIRIITIPIEDMMYGFELLIVTLFFFEKFKDIHLASLTMKSQNTLKN